MLITGKSTLSDCLLELTGNISTKEKQNKAQFTDTLKVRAKAPCDLRGAYHTMKLVEV
jgi:translation elongation factor EF-4